MMLPEDERIVELMISKKLWCFYDFDEGSWSNWKRKIGWTIERGSGLSVERFMFRKEYSQKAWIERWFAIHYVAIQWRDEEASIKETCVRKLASRRKQIDCHSTKQDSS